MTIVGIQETNSLAKVARRYRAEFGMEPPQLSQIKKWHQNFLETGSVTPKAAPTPASTFTKSPLVTAVNLGQLGGGKSIYADRL